MKSSARIALFVLLAAACSFLCWNIEVRYVKGWDGLAWLSGSLTAGFFCTFFVVIAALLPVTIGEKIKSWKIVLAFLLLYAIVMFSYWLSLLGFTALRAIWFYGGWMVLLLFALALLLTTTGFYFMIHKLLRPMRKLYMLYIVLALSAGLGLSKLTILLFPVHGETDFVHTIKAGYQQFWIGVTLALAAAAGRMKKAD